MANEPDLGDACPDLDERVEGVRLQHGDLPGWIAGDPEHLYDAAKVDGATAWRRFLNVTLPLLSPTTFFVVVISVISSFQVFDQALIMTNGGPGTATTTLVLYIYQQGFQSFEMGYAAAVALVLFAAIFVFTVIQFLFQRRWVTYD